MKIHKVKSKKNAITIKYDVTNGQTGDPDEFSFTCHDRALPAFYEEFVRLAPQVCDICEFPDDYEANLTVVGVSFSYTETKDGEVMGAVITALKKLDGANSPLVINTPYLPSQSMSDSKSASMSDGKVLPDDCIRVLEDLQVEAERYIQGKRAQTEMFTEAAA